MKLHNFAVKHWVLILLEYNILGLVILQVVMDTFILMGGKELRTYLSWVKRAKRSKVTPMGKLYTMLRVSRILNSRKYIEIKFNVKFFHVKPK